jgi:hypothetical protein
MRARIYRPAKTAMQSGWANTRRWVLEMEPEAAQVPDPLMGWNGSSDTRRQIRLRFSTLEEAESYAKRNGLEYVVLPAHQPKRKYRSYADNFR